MGIFAPRSENFLGLFKNSTTSASSSFSSSAPATSEKRTLMLVETFAFVLPKLIALLPPPIVERMTMKIATTPMTSTAR